MNKKNKNIEEKNDQEEVTLTQPASVTKLNTKDIKEIEADELVDKVMKQILEIK